MLIKHCYWKCFCTTNLGETSASAGCDMDCADTPGEICGEYDIPDVSLSTDVPFVRQTFVRVTILHTFFFPPSISPTFPYLL